MTAGPLPDLAAPRPPDARAVASEGGRAGGRLTIASVLVAMTLVVLDAGMVNVALPSMAEALSASAARSVLVVIAYQTALVMALLPCAALGARFGDRRIFQAGVAVFVAASIACALSPSLPTLVAARFLQGLGGAAVMALGVALLRTTVGSHRLGEAVGWNALTVALASAAAPALGALIVARLEWPWLFMVNLPVGALALAASRGLPSPAGSPAKLDLASMALNGGAFALMIAAAEVAPAAPMTAAALFGLGALAFTLLVRREAPKAAPLIPLDLLRIPAFRLSVVASICCFTGQAAAMVALPFYLQNGLGQSALMVGAYISPWPLSVALTAPLAGRLSDRVPGAWLCAGGGVLLGLGLAGAAFWPMHGDPGPMLAFAVISGAGFGLFQAPNNRNMFEAAPLGRSGAAGGMQGTARLTGQVCGALLMTLLLTTTPVAAPRLGLGIAAVFALAAALVSLLRTSRPGMLAHAPL